MENPSPVAAFLYDFDKTLCTTDMQDYSFIPSLGFTPAEFWERVDRFARENRMDGILAYMYVMIRESVRAGRPFTRDDLRAKGREIVFFPGVADWFERVNRYARAEGVVVEHYVVSSGLREIIEGSEIQAAFREIYASEFYYDQSGRPVWPRLAVNYTNKTQFLYRVNKGVLDVSDDKTLNAHMPDDSKRIPFRNMVYFGDGLSDVPCMKMTRSYGGRAVAVWQDANRDAVRELLLRGRVDYIFPADYRPDGALESAVRDMLRSIAVTSRLRGEHAAQMRACGG